MRAAPDLTDEALLLDLAAELTQRRLELVGVLDHDFHETTHLLGRQNESYRLRRLLPEENKESSGPAPDSSSSARP